MRCPPSVSFAASRLQEARHQVEHRGLPAAARPQETEELSLHETETEARQHRHGLNAPAARIAVAHVTRHEEFFNHARRTPLLAVAAFVRHPEAARAFWREPHKSAVADLCTRYSDLG